MLGLVKVVNINILELSYLIMNSMGIFVSMIMFSAYRYNEIKEMKRLQKLDKLISGEIYSKENQN